MEKRDNEYKSKGKIVVYDPGRNVDTLEAIHMARSGITRFFMYDCHLFPSFLELENVEEYFKKRSKSIFGESTKVEKVDVEKKDPENVCRAYVKGTKIVDGHIKCKMDEGLVVVLFYGPKTPTGKSHFNAIGYMAGEPHTNYEWVRRTIGKIKELTDFSFISSEYPPSYDPIEEIGYYTLKDIEFLVFTLEHKPKKLGFFKDKLGLKDIAKVGENFYRKLFKDDNFVVGGYKEGEKYEMGTVVFEGKDNEKEVFLTYVKLTYTKRENALVGSVIRGLKVSDEELRNIILEINKEMSDCKIIKAERCYADDQQRKTGVRRIL